MNYRRENSGHSSVENTVAHPAQMVPNQDPSVVGMQSSTSACNQLLDTLKSPASAQQQQKVLAILKTNPRLMAAFIKQRAAQQQKNHQLFQQQCRLNMPHLQKGLQQTGSITKIANYADLEKMNFERENSGHSSIENTVAHPAQMVLNPDPSIVGKQDSTLAWKCLETLKSPASAMIFDSEHSSIGNAVVHPAQIVQNPDPSIAGKQSSTLAWKCLETLKSPASAMIFESEHSSIGNAVVHPAQIVQNPVPSIAGMQSSTLAWKSLLETLKSPVSAQQQQQVLAILKANPQLMAAFIKQRTAQQQQNNPLFLQQRQLLMQQHQLHMQYIQKELQHHRQLRMQRLCQRQQRTQMLLERNMIGYPAVRSRQELPNLDPAVTDMQIPTEEFQQILENLKTLNLD